MALIRQVPEDHPLPDAPLCPVKVEAAEIISRRGLSDHVGPEWSTGYDSRKIYFNSVAGSVHR